MERPASPAEDFETEEVADRETDISPSVKEAIPFDEIIDYLNEKTGKNFRPGSSKTK